MARKTTTRNDDHEAMMAASKDERDRANAAIAAGGVAIIDTFVGSYRVTGVTSDWWYASHPADKAPDWANTRSWAGCNDGQWADILRQLGVVRNARWA